MLNGPWRIGGTLMTTQASAYNARVIAATVTVRGRSSPAQAATRIAPRPAIQPLVQGNGWMSVAKLP